MTKTEFIKTFNEIHKNSREIEAIDLLHDITRLSMRMCTQIIRNLWNCSDPKFVGNNIYDLVKVSADGDESRDPSKPKLEYKPKLKKGCNVYFVYLDEHIAFFALHKIKQYKN